MMATARQLKMCRSLLRALVAFSVSLFAMVGATSALAAETHAHWALESRAAPEHLLPGKEAMIVATATNLGDAEVNGGTDNSTVRITDKLPEGVSAISVARQLASTSSNTVAVKEKRKAEFTCAKEKGALVECSYTGKLPPYELLGLLIRVSVSSSAPAQSSNEVTVSGGEAQSEPVSLKRPVTVSDERAAFGIESFEMTPENEQFEPDTQAGSHPFQLTTTFNLDQGFELAELDQPQTNYPSAPALQKTLNFRLPAGLIGNVNAVKQCSDSDFGAQGREFSNPCPNETAIGVASVTVFDPNGHGEYYATYVVPVFNLEPAAGEPAKFGFSILHVPVVLDTSVRTGEDYGVNVTVSYASQTVQVLGSKVTFWGIPGDERHNISRGWLCLGHGNPGEVENCGKPETPSSPLLSYLTLPTKCGALESGVEGEAWNAPILEGRKEFSRLGQGGEPLLNEHPTMLTNCSALEYNPTINVAPETQAGSTPTGLNVNVSLPQSGTVAPSYTSTAEAAVSSTTLELPIGLQASAGASNGLEACSVGQAGFNGVGTDTGNVLAVELESERPFNTAQPSCPDASKIGSVSIKTPLLERELTGGLYLAEQDTDPFASPLVLYLIAEDKAPDEQPDESKVLVKLAGEVTINPTNGQLVSKFKNTPQSPFETLNVHLWNGSRASQVTPSRCGTYHTKSLYTTSSQGVPSAEPEYEFQITTGPEGQPCPGATLPFQPSFRAESTDDNAGAYSPFTLHIARPDGDAALKTIDMQLAPGMAAVLASVPECQEPLAAEGNCGPESKIGESISRSGLGSDPYQLPGSVYLTGPYNGAPFGLSSVTNAQAGPFHLGKIVVRSGITVNPYTAAATVDTEASQFFPEAPTENEQTVFAGLPEMLKGVPAQLKELEVTINRPNFEFNPTSCEPMSITGSLTGYEGTSAGVSSPFKVGNCGALPFKPTLTATVSGQGSKPDGVTFEVKVESEGIGQANIHKVDLALPEVLPSRLETLQKACLESVFNVNPASCNEESVIGKGIVHTPVFTNPLEGNAYLVAHGGAEFPDVEFVLKGEGVTVILDGKTDIKKGITYSKFETSPDAPFTSFQSIFPAGPHSALTSYVPEKENFNLCKSASKLTMPTEITGQDGAFISQNTKISLLGCGAVLGSHGTKLTRKQKLAKALKACRTKYKKKKTKRIACEKQARKKYGPVHKKKKSAHKSAGSSSTVKR